MGSSPFIVSITIVLNSFQIYILNSWTHQISYYCIYIPKILVMLKMERILTHQATMKKP
jgi:hypothetical protein